jgi:hypothetical protein
MTGASNELDNLVYIPKGDDEPDWCVDGTYLAYRKILEDLEAWERLNDKDQEKMIGRRKKGGRPLTRRCTGPGKMVPVYWDNKGELDARMPRIATADAGCIREGESPSSAMNWRGRGRPVERSTGRPRQWRATMVATI